MVLAIRAVLSFQEGGKLAIHVFIDNSNIFGGAQRAAKQLEPAIPWRAVRVYYRNLFQVIEGGRNAFTRVMGGSVPPGNEDLWEHAKTWGYSTDLLKRVEADNGRLVEQAVDEVLHLKIANTLLDFESGTLVVVTGDGQNSEFDTSFPKQVERALKRKWNVEVWSWDSQLANVYRRMSEPSLKVLKLDPYYQQVTFVKGGTHGGVSVQERIVAKLT